MLEVKVTVTLAPEVLGLFSQLIDGVQTGKTKKDSDSSGKVLDYQKKNEAETDNASEDANCSDKITLEDLTSLAKGLLTSDDTREGLKSVLAEMGLKKVSEAKKKDFDALYEKLTALQKGA